MKKTVIFRSRLKKIVSPAIRLVLAILPKGVLVFVVRVLPRLLPYVPPGRALVYKKFLGDVTVSINTTYRIEKEMLTGVYEKNTISIFRRYINNGDICFDIGANVGALSFAMAKLVKDKGGVYSFEPGEEIYGRLVNNVRMNPDYANIIIPVKKAFSDEEKIMYWNEDIANRGNGGFLIQQPNQQQPVRLSTMDKFVRENALSKIDFIKIDVEGMEYDVIKGGIGSIEKYRPALYYETGFFEKGFWAEIARNEKVILKIEKMLLKLGYVIYRVEGDSIKETRYPDLSYNTLAVYMEK